MTENRLSHALPKGVNGILLLIDLNEIRYKTNIQLLCNFYLDENRYSEGHILLKGLKTSYQYFIQREYKRALKPNRLFYVKLTLFSHKIFKSQSRLTFFLGPSSYSKYCIYDSQYYAADRKTENKTEGRLRFLCCKHQVVKLLFRKLNQMGEFGLS